MSWDVASPEMQALLDAVVALRRDIHAHPEPGFEEHETRKRIIAALGEHAGLSEASMRFCAGTGLIVDIVSTGGAAALPSQGELPIVKTIALRADMDALRMTEGNLDLPHRSQNEGVAHMCGHDGHTAALVVDKLVLSMATNSPDFPIKCLCECRTVLTNPPGPTYGYAAKVTRNRTLTDRGVE